MTVYTLPSSTWTASPNYSSRGGQRVRLVVAHDCEGSFLGSVGWFAQARSRVSANAVLSDDGKRIVQMVDWRNKAWHVCDFNSVSEGIEMAGFEAKGFDAPEWAGMAAVIAWRLRANGLRPVWAQDGNGEGFCSHRDLGARGGGHSDPTTDPAIWAAFVARVQEAYEQVPGGDLPVGPAALAPAAPAGWKPSGTVRHDHPVGSLEWIQLELNALGIPRAPLIVDGMMGPATMAAVEAFQRSRALYIDGQPGPRTIAALKQTPPPATAQAPAKPA